MFDDSNYLQLSGLQHFAFCRRQWALIHVEKQWAENLRTVDGTLMHRRAHDASARESRGDLLIVRDMPVSSPTLGITGACDVVEFHRSASGIMLPGRSGSWQAFPIEYKRGAPKAHDADRLQLCAQAMCLEEMLCCESPEGALYYGETRRRETVPLDEPLRRTVHDMLVEMHDLYSKGRTPKVRPGKGCAACSLRELCLPSMLRRMSASSYLSIALEELST